MDVQRQSDGVSPVRIAIKRLPGAEDLEVPRYMSDGAVGLDIPAAVAGDLVLRPGEFAKVPTGFAVAIPEGYEGQVRPRSGLAARHGLTLVNAPGTIDADYRGEIAVILMNLGPEPYTVARGARIAQLVISPVVRAQIDSVAELPPTRRGEGGFGHTGT